MEDFHTDHSAARDEQRTTSSMPPCCGSGCAVCVLDYWVDDEPGLLTQEEITGGSIQPELPELSELPQLPQLPQLLVLLEAFEDAERQAKQMIVHMDESE
jgi:hypothetical protein